MLLLDRMCSLCFSASRLSRDPMAEKYPSLSPYSYCAGDPGEPHVRNMQENEY